ncbi:unnamed protein product [Dovyalis caffra]|uniref:Uncharacterized protein n=1 Tax=Dovyalis caffra TaxID=77055 RepID=A0AAV1RTQ2_9ROSI|nr:unnamed protein product [Dovyalis caffra]
MSFSSASAGAQNQLCGMGGISSDFISQLIGKSYCSVLRQKIEEINADDDSDEDGKDNVHKVEDCIQGWN